MQLVRNGETVERIAINAMQVNHEWTVTRREPGEFWYCRLIYAGNDIAWSSPIWLE